MVVWRRNQPNSNKPKPQKQTENSPELSKQSKQQNARCKRDNERLCGSLRAAGGNELEALGASCWKIEKE